MAEDSVDSVTFGVYTERYGELTQEEFVSVRKHDYSQASYSLAFARLTLAAQKDSAPYPTHSDIEAAAKLVGALGERVPRDLEGHPQALWLLTEAYLLQGKDTEKVLAALIKDLVGNP